ncbi:unnamed protein product [Cuscuta campestris]|uniref:Uncharacterized protein n=1 Tax=Cuscuta campestris TaxID=132261 RepID=A0A484M043_9ASTE|nr:unnamed protein product [Cuscuta campestris]
MSPLRDSNGQTNSSTYIEHNKGQLRNPKPIGYEWSTLPTYTQAPPLAINKCRKTYLSIRHWSIEPLPDAYHLPMRTVNISNKWQGHDISSNSSGFCYESNACFL